MLHAMVVAVVGTIVAALSAVPATTAAPVERGVTRTTVTVGGLVSDPVAKGADLGARARFQRAARNGRISGRTINYVGARNTTDTSAVAGLVDTAFAVVPAIGISQEATTFAKSALPFVGVAGSPEWFGNRWGFGITGAPLSERSTTGSPAWGVQLRALLGGSRGKRVVVVTEGDAAGTVGAAATNAALRSAGFQVAPRVALPAPPVDAVATARTLVGASPPLAAVIVLATNATSLAIAQQLAALGYTGTVGVGEAFYVPDTPTFGAGLTVLVPIAPVEADTPAIRRMVADVRAVDPAAVVTPAVVAGYFSADFFLDVLRRVGRKLTARRFASVANGGTFTYEVPGTIGASTWPAMHTRTIPCGALVQGDGTRYFPIEPYRCDPAITLARKS